MKLLMISVAVLAAMAVVPALAAAEETPQEICDQWPTNQSPVDYAKCVESWERNFLEQAERKAQKEAEERVEAETQAREDAERRAADEAEWAAEAAAEERRKARDVHRHEAAEETRVRARARHIAHERAWHKHRRREWARKPTVTQAQAARSTRYALRQEFSSYLYKYYNCGGGKIDHTHWRCGVTLIDVFGNCQRGTIRVAGIGWWRGSAFFQTRLVGPMRPCRE